MHQFEAFVWPPCAENNCLIAFGAALGRIVEHSRLTAQEAQAAIDGYEAAARCARPAVSEPASQADAVRNQLMVVKNGGGRAQRARKAVTKRT